MATLLSSLSDDMADVVSDVRQSLVHVHNGRQRVGAGSIWHPDGLILTNAHVVGSPTLRVTLPDGRTLPARTVADDRSLDLAALAVDAIGLPTVPIGDSRLLRPGQVVMAVGHPWGVSGAATAGVVIGVGSGIPEVPMSEKEWIVASLRLRPGNSGGPMIDTAGRLVEINAMIAGPEVAMSVPVHVAKRFLQNALDRTRVAQVA